MSIFFNSEETIHHTTTMLAFQFALMQKLPKIPMGGGYGTIGVERDGCSGLVDYCDSLSQ